MRLTPGSTRLLVALSRSAVLRQARYSSRLRFLLIKPTTEELERVHARAVNMLRQLALIERKDEFDWRISEAGVSWLAANKSVSKVAD